ncbi:hypothetical protein RJ55_01536 [Drechmeria coniospora]|nr:hypothetical protein RJ55_01536 [Drechmeria coniospora]
MKLASARSLVARTRADEGDAADFEPARKTTTTTTMTMGQQHRRDNSDVSVSSLSASSVHSSSSPPRKPPPARPKPAPALELSHESTYATSPPRLPRTSSLLPPRVVADATSTAGTASTSHSSARPSIYAYTTGSRHSSKSSVDHAEPPNNRTPHVNHLHQFLPLPVLDEGSDGRHSSLEVLPGGDASDRDTSGPSPDPLRPDTSDFRLKMAFDDETNVYQNRSHSRNRSGQGSLDSTRSRGSKPPSQKAMLSRALQEANTAVQLDNAHNFEGARLAYSEACELLQQVLQKTQGDEDKRKLEAIHQTYASRILELNQMKPWLFDGDKALPARPAGLDLTPTYDPEADGAEPISHAAEDNQHAESHRTDSSAQNRLSRGPWRDGSREHLHPISSHHNGPLRSAFSSPPARLQSKEEGSGRQGDRIHMPPPPPPPPATAAAVRPLSPSKPQPDGANEVQRERSFTSGSASWSESMDAGGHLRDNSQNSWLDPIDESAGSSASSVHSRTSSLRYRRKHLRAVSENEFDTALDAAIEAAYDDGYEPMGLGSPEQGDRRDEGVDDGAPHRVDMARERTQQPAPNVYEGGMRHPHPGIAGDISEGFYDDNSSDEEERLLEEMTRGYGMDDFGRPQDHGFSIPPPEALQPVPDPPPRQRPPPVADGGSPPLGTDPKNVHPSAPPPTHSLPELPGQRPPPPQTVRSRRLSGQNPKQLKIETSTLRPPPAATAEAGDSRSRSASTAERQPAIEAPAVTAAALVTAKRVISPKNEAAIGEPAPVEFRRSSRDQAAGAGAAVAAVGAAAAAVGASAVVATGDERRPSSPKQPYLRKNFSSSSLRSRNMSQSNAEEGFEVSPGTPSSSAHYSSLRTPIVTVLPMPPGPPVRENVDGSATGGLHLFEDSFHMPQTPGSPNPLSFDAPVSLEACPNEYMLRPFWLMRCLYQTLVHPRGGYLSTKLFVPRDAWKVKGAKLKNLEDKISNCDLLTAALLKLAKVDTCDADAVLDEMQALEGVLEQVQSVLTRKLGNEVGVHSSSILFKEASNVVEEGGPSSLPRTSSVSTKSSFSWRRLRPKNSGLGLGGAYNSKMSGSEGGKDLVTLPTLPMTAQPTSRPARRDVGQAQFAGPNAHYMGSLARLFDAAQAIDQIARQVDDPGLRHADKTQVGLELCTRHAAEFFGFYICRFVLADLSMLMDKFIKRGSEWVLG